DRPDQLRLRLAVEVGRPVRRLLPGIGAADRAGGGLSEWRHGSRVASGRAACGAADAGRGVLTPSRAADIPRAASSAMLRHSPSGEDQRNRSVGRKFMAYATRSVLLALPLLVAALAPGHAQQALNPLTAMTPVTDDMLKNPPPGDWLMWRRTYNGWGY